jgi:hypothetical protein
MRNENDRAFKEWAVACRAMERGRQTLLVRKGGIYEEGGVFTIADREFFLMPTYEHQKAELLQPELVADLDELTAAAHSPDEILISAYAVVDTIAEAKDEDQVMALAAEHIWNEVYVKMRFDFNPYDPVYLILLRVYRLPRPFTVPMRREYEGCKSWVTLESPLATAGAAPVLSDAEFELRKARIAGLSAL